MFCGVATGSTRPVATGARCPTELVALVHDGPTHALQVPSGCKRRSTASPAGTVKLDATGSVVVSGGKVVVEVVVDVGTVEGGTVELGTVDVGTVDVGTVVVGAVDVTGGTVVVVEVVVLEVVVGTGTFALETTNDADEVMTGS